MSWCGNPVWAHEARLARRRWLHAFGTRRAKWCALACVACYASLLVTVPQWLAGDADGVFDRGLLGLLALLTPGLAATALVGERRRGTWSLLTATPLRPDELLLGKYWGRVAPLLALAGLGLTVVAAISLADGDSVPWQRLGVDLLYLVPTILGLSGLGLFCSARCRSVSGALLWAYSLSAGLLVGVPLLVAGGWLRLRWGYCLSPWFSLREGGASGTFAVPGAACYLVLAAVGVLWPLVRFEEWLRTDEAATAGRHGGLPLPLVAVLHAWRLARRGLRLGARWLVVLAGYALLEGSLWRWTPTRSAWGDVTRFLLPSLTVLVSWGLARCVAPAPLRVARRLARRFGVSWPQLVLGRFAVVATLSVVGAGALLLPAVLACQQHQLWTDWAPAELEQQWWRLALLASALAVLATSRDRAAPWLRGFGAVLGLLAAAWAVRWIDFLGGTLAGRAVQAVYSLWWYDGGDTAGPGCLSYLLDQVPADLVVATLGGLALLAAMVPESQNSDRTYGSHATHARDFREATP